jgi:hypothetical protein
MTYGACALSSSRYCFYFLRRCRFLPSFLFPFLSSIDGKGEEEDAAASRQSAAAGRRPSSIFRSFARARWIDLILSINSIVTGMTDDDDSLCCKISLSSSSWS